MKTLALWAIALALLVMAAVDLYESPDMVCARKRDRALEKYDERPMITSRYRVHLTETIQQKKDRDEFAREVQASKDALENFDEAYQKYLQLHDNLNSVARAAIERKYSACRGDWKAKK